ncbi:MAG: HAD family hydrolase [Jatrophihabitans sp.]|uniref:HAD family hydrolase n=1 Tax=Jatrophihabitans sp. TaxID=1932789 RepID=UPI003F81A0AB
MDDTTSRSSLAAVLVDMDGTIVDTEPYWIAAEYQIVAAHGGEWSDELALSLVGNDLLVSGAIIRDRGGVDLPPETIVEQLLDEVIRQCERAIPWRPGALRLLRDLNADGVPCALVTMSYLRLAETVTRALPAGTFATLVTGDQVRQGKPHPDAYLLAAERLGVDPAACVAIEDSPTGVASAEAAGCVVIAVPHHVPIEPAPTRTVVDSLTELDPARLRRMVAPAPGSAA